MHREISCMCINLVLRIVVEFWDAAVFLTLATPLNNSQILQLLKTDVEWQSALLFHGINPTAWMYDSGRFLSDARSLSQQNCDMETGLVLQFGFLWNFYTLISLMYTYVFIHLNTSLQFYFQCSWHNERERCLTSPGLIPFRIKIFLSSKMLQLALVPRFFSWE